MRLRWDVKKQKQDRRHNMKESLSYDDVKQIVNDKMELQRERITLSLWMSGGAIFFSFVAVLICLWYK